MYVELNPHKVQQGSCISCISSLLPKASQKSSISINNIFRKISKQPFFCLQAEIFHESHHSFWNNIISCGIMRPEWTGWAPRINMNMHGFPMAQWPPGLCRIRMFPAIIRTRARGWKSITPKATHTRARYICANNNRLRNVKHHQA